MTEFTPVPRYGNLRKMRYKACYRNAFHVATTRPGMSYAEGMARPHGQPRWVHHAWNVDAEGHAVDVTWNVPGNRYVGIVFSFPEVCFRMAACWGAGCSGAILSEAQAYALLAEADPDFFEQCRLWAERAAAANAN